VKIERFLNSVQKELLNYPDINFPTLKLFIDKFTNCLSKNEQKRWNISIQMISEITLKQITIDSFIFKENKKKLAKELAKLKREAKKK